MFRVLPFQCSYCNCCVELLARHLCIYKILHSNFSLFRSTQKILAKLKKKHTQNRWVTITKHPPRIRLGNNAVCVCLCNVCDRCWIISCWLLPTRNKNNRYRLWVVDRCFFVFVCCLYMTFDQMSRLIAFVYYKLSKRVLLLIYLYHKKIIKYSYLFCNFIINIVS